MLVKEMKGGKGKDLNSERGGKISGRTGRRSGEKCLKGERGKRCLGGKGKSFSGGTGPKGQCGGRISNRKGGKRLWEEKGGDLGGKRP